MFYDSGIPYSYLNSHGIRIRVDYSGRFATVTQNTECQKKQIRDLTTNVLASIYYMHPQKMRLPC